MSNKPLFLFGGLIGVGLLMVSSSSRGRKTLQEAGAAVAEEIEQGMDWIGRVVGRTSKHEGTYDTLALNPDNAGLSFGILQWAQRPGSLGNLLEEFYAADAALFTRTFGPSWQSLMRSTKVGSLEPVAGAVLWHEPWVSRFRAAGREPTFRAVQDRLAASGTYMKAAIDSAKMLGLTTERGVSLMYDTATQQGPNGVRKYATWLASNIRGQVYPARYIMLRFVDIISFTYVRYAAPTGPHSNPAFEWKKVGAEWHVFAGKIDLYTNIRIRRMAIVNDPKISDKTVNI